jgi:hypothetical protein
LHCLMVQVGALIYLQNPVKVSTWPSMYDHLNHSPLSSGPVQITNKALVGPWSEQTIVDRGFGIITSRRESLPCGFGVP